MRTRTPVAPLVSLLACSAALAACAPASATPPASAADRHRAEADVAHVLDDWHAAAARADEEGYFAQFADGGIFLGTDATERWDVAAFRAYAHPHFAKGKAWAFRATRRAVTVSTDGALAWFDEDLSTEKLGPARGSGVLSHRSGQWKIEQYNLAIVVPNERFAEVHAVLGRPPAPAKP
jgi:hypothetical protein